MPSVRGQGMTGLLYRVHPQGSLYFAPKVVERILLHRQMKPASKEAGGVLLGRHLEGVPDVIVDAVTEPMLGDRRSWASFFRSFRHQISARRRWKRRSRTSAYLGSWHTHPEPDPHPSGVDTSDWRQALTRDAYEGLRLFFVIVGTQQLRVWQGDRCGEILELELIREHHEKEGK
jgi:integrative and conjugative element protein (TIGR02256 family)